MTISIDAPESLGLGAQSILWKSNPSSVKKLAKHIGSVQWTFVRVHFLFFVQKIEMVRLKAIH